MYSTTTYEPLGKTVQDEEQTNALSPHAGCGARFIEDGLQSKNGSGRLRQVHEIVKLTDAGVPGPLTSWVTNYSYDLRDNFTGYADSRNNLKSLTYDGLGRRTSMNDPDRGRTDYTHDAAGNLLRTVDAKGQVITYTYDGANRVLTEHYGTGKTPPEVEYHYDTPQGPVDRGYLWESKAPVIADVILGRTGAGSAQDLNSDSQIDVADAVKAARDARSAVHTLTAENTNGRLAWVRDKSGEEHWSFDARGRNAWTIKRIVNTAPADLNNFFTGYEYDSMDRVTRLTYPDGAQVSYAYNSRGLLESVLNVVTRYDYTAAGAASVEEMACGVNGTRQYDSRLRLARLRAIRSRDNASLQNLAYTYDGVSNIVRVQDDRTTSDLDAVGQDLGIASEEARKFNGTQSFQYDSLYRLTQGSNPTVWGSINYKYDRIGNMISQSASLTSPEPSIDLGQMSYGGAGGSSNRAGGDVPGSPGPHAFTSSARGGLAVTYDANGNVAVLRGMALAWDFEDRLTEVDKGTQKVVHTYDYAGARKKRILSDSVTGTSSRSLYIGKSSEVRDGQLFKYVYGVGGQRLARASGGDAKSSVLRPDCFFLCDHVNSTSLTLAPDATATESVAYYPFGHVRIERSRTSDAQRADYRYAGKERDRETALLYFGARYYDDSFAHFLSVDPLLATPQAQRLLRAQSLNLYAYVSNSPIVRIDPTGAVDTELLIKGSLILISGAASTTGGAAVVTTTGVTVVGAVAGGLWMAGGIAKMGTGLSLMAIALIDPARNDEERQRLRDGADEANRNIGKATLDPGPCAAAGAGEGAHALGASPALRAFIEGATDATVGIIGAAGAAKGLVAARGKAGDQLGPALGLLNYDRKVAQAGVALSNLVNNDDPTQESEFPSITYIDFEEITLEADPASVYRPEYEELESRAEE